MERHFTQVVDRLVFKSSKVIRVITYQSLARMMSKELNMSEAFS